MHRNSGLFTSTNYNVIYAYREKDKFWSKIQYSLFIGRNRECGYTYQRYRTDVKRNIIMQIQIIACGSKVTDYLKRKWGLSLLIDGDILFDTFSSEKILKANFEKYNIDPGKIKHIVISHEHWDHIGGLDWVLKNNKNVNVYICKRSGDKFKNKIKEYGCPLIEVTGETIIKKNILTTGEIAGEYKNQPIFEQSLILKKRDKIAIITGCSHPGILKILAYISLKHKSRIELLLGGLHLMDKSIDQISEITIMLNSLYKVKNLAPLHCTGSKALKYFNKNFQQNFIEMKTGDYITFK